MVDWTSVSGGPRRRQAQQRHPHAGRSGDPLDGVERFQRRGSLRRQPGCRCRRAQHQHLHRHEPFDLGDYGPHLFQKAISHRRGPGYDYGLGRHHTRGRRGGRMGRHSPRFRLRHGPLDLDEHFGTNKDHAPSRRHPRRLPHAFRRRHSRRCRHRYVSSPPVPQNFLTNPSPQVSGPQKKAAQPSVSPTPAAPSPATAAKSVSK